MRAPDDLALEPLPSLDAARDAWVPLAEARGSIYGTWEWAVEWWRVFGAGRELLLHACVAPDGRTVAILPLYVARRGPVPVARFLGHGLADELAPVCAPEDRPAAGRALARVARERLGRRGVVLAERMPAEEGWERLARASVLRHESSPLLEIGGRTWDEWLAGRSANFRQQVRRRERRLLRDGALAYRRVTDAAALDAELDVLLALHDARWGDESGAFTSRRREFHRAFARRALENGWLRLWFADLHGEPAAAWLGFRYGGVEWYYQAGRDPARADDNVGFVLLSHTIREAIGDGMLRYRFGLGAEAYKSRFADADPGLVTLLAGGRVLPAAAAVASATVRRAPHSLRDRVLARLAP